MARLRRLALPHVAHHVILRAQSGNPPFMDDMDRGTFVRALTRAATECGVTVHAYALGRDCVHMLATPSTSDALARLVQGLARWYSAPFNRRYGRRGVLWQSRFQAAPVESGDDFFCCMRYIEQFPSREGWTAPLAEYPWSSAAPHSGLEPWGALCQLPHEATYWRLGNTPFEREAAYWVLLETPLPASDVARLTESTLRGWPMGSGEFLALLLAASGRPVAPRPRGRPRKVASAEIARQ